MFLDVRAACERWLKKRGLGQSLNYGRALERPSSVISRPAEKPISKTKLRRMKKYATLEERRAAMQAKTSAYWATVSLEHKAKRLDQMNGGKHV